MIAEDSPGEPLALLGQDFANREDSFKMWLLFEPDVVDSIPVPLAKGDWGWEAEATRAGNTWTINDSDESLTAPADTTDFPEWDKNITDIESTENE